MLEEDVPLMELCGFRFDRGIYLMAVDLVDVKVLEGWYSG